MARADRQWERGEMNRNDLLLKRFEGQFDLLLRFFVESGIEQLDRRPPSDKWSALENAAHLGRYQQLFLERVCRILREHQPHFEPYRAEGDPEFPHWTNLSVSELLKQMNTDRQEILSRVQKLSPSQLRRVGIHSRLGPLELALWIEFFLVHEAHHLYTMLKRLHGVD